MRPIYHLVTRSAWEQAPAEAYRAGSLASEGFIHCSYAEQVAWAANRFYAEAADLLVLQIDPGKLTSPLKAEAAAHGEVFPHIYGPIDRAAVVAVLTLGRGGDGQWVFVPD